MLRPAGLGDLAYIRSLVQRPGNAPYLTDEDEAGLTAYLNDPSAHLLIWGDHRGFALFCEVGKTGDIVELRRLCLDQPGKGEGALFVQTLIDHAFQVYRAQRLWLDCSSENLRAQRVYLREGFTLEGRLRQHEFITVINRTIDTLIYGMLRNQWQALPRISGLAAAPPHA